MKYFFIILLLASSKLYAQDVSVIYKTDTIFFFGYDFTHFTLAENHVVNDPGRYIFPWIMYISKYSTSYFYEKNLLATVLYDFTNICHRFRSISNHKGTRSNNGRPL